MDPNIQNYINQARASGKTDEQIIQELLRAGWSQAQVNDAFGVPNPQSGATPPPPPPPPQPPFNGQILQGAGNNKIMAIISYLGILWIIPMATGAKNDPFVKFHVKQGIVLFVVDIVVWVVAGFIPFLGAFLSPILNLALLALAIMGIINASNGVQKPLPAIGQFADNLKF